MRKLKIIVSVTNDLVTDQRVNRVCTALVKHGGELLLVGRRKKDSLSMPERPYKSHRMKLWFEKGALFYANYNLRLFFFLLFNKVDILVSNDLDTLLPNYLVSKLKDIPLVYDSHEYYTGVPELQNRKIVKGIWHSIERFIFPKLKYVYTVNDSIAKLYEDEYKVKLSVVRNIPAYKPLKIDETIDLNLPPGKKMILYQGAGINVDRGVEEVVEAMQYVDNALLVIVGSGDVIDFLKQQVLDLKLESKVRFIAKVPFEQLKQYTLRADIGLTVDKDTNINYRFSLPNKLFDYIHAGVPVLASDLPEVAKIIRGYNVGTFIQNHDPEHIATVINEMLKNEAQLVVWKENALRVSEELSWQNEEKILISVYKDLLGH